MRNSSHVNINEITEYNQNTRRQRPQTGKLRNTALAQQYSTSNVSQSGQQSGGYVVIGPLQSQFNNQHHRRLTSAKQDPRFRQKYQLGGGGPESHLSNTRDVIQSNGYLTTMAGSNIEALSRGKSRRSLAAQATAALPPSQPIVKQHFVPNPASKRLQSAKGPMMRNQPSLVITNHQSAGRQSPRHHHVVKSGSIATNLSRKAARHSRQRAISGNQHKTVDTAKDTTGQLSDLFHKMQVTTPLPTAKALQASHFQVEPDALQHRLDIVDAQSTDAENERQVMTSGSEPLNLAIESTVINNAGHFKTKGGGATTSSKMSVNRKRKPSAKARRPTMNRTIYKLPSLSQCIEQKILPRSSEYMRQLYSIALKNHENQVPNMAPTRKYDMPEMSPTITNTNNDTFQLSPDLTQANPAEIQDAAMNLLNAQKVEQAVNQVLNRSSGDQPDKAKGMENRSHSLAQLHKVNLEFPFDSMVHGCFSRQKQMDLNLCPNPHSREPIRSSGGDYESKRKRPMTAGRVPAPPNMDLFSNKFISQVANQMSSPQLALGPMSQQLTQKTHEGIFHNDTEQLMAHDSSKALSSALSHYQTAAVNQVERQTTSSVHNQFSNLQSQFANVMDPNKAQTQIALVVMPQHGQDPNQATIKQIGPSDSKAYFQVLNLNEMPQSEEANQLAGDGDMTQELMTNKKNYQQQQQERTEDNFSSQLRRSASSRGSKSTHSRKSRQHSAKGKISSYKLARPADLGLNALSQRDSKQKYQRNGTQFSVQVSGQAIQGVKITSSRQGESRKAADTPSSSRTGGSNNMKKSRQKQKSNLPDVKLSSTHSLKIQMNKTNAKETERSSRNDTNRLDEHDEIDERFRHGNKKNTGDQFDPNLKGRSRSITGSNQNLEYNEETGQNVRSIYPVTGFQASPNKKRYSQPNDESQPASQQSHSQNILDNQMRLKQVYQEATENQANRQIHRIPLAQGQQSIGSLPSGPGQDSSRHQVLVVTDSPTKVRQIVMSQDASVTNMSNPLNNFQFSVEKMQPIKIKSVVFDGKGNYQEAERVSAHGQTVEQGSIPTAIGSPNRSSQNPLFSHQYSPSQRQNTHSHTHANALAQERSKSPTEKKTGENGEKAPEEGEVFNQHKRFVVTQPIKRQSSQRETSNSRTQVPIRGAPVCQKHSLRGRHMRLQSADMKHKRQYLMQSRQAKLGSQSNIHVAMVQELFDSQGILQLDALMENNLALADFTNLQNTASNINSVPPLALPTDSGTEINNSRLPSSRRALHIETQGSAFGSKQLAIQSYIRSEDSQKILNSFNQNNVRTALRGENAARLFQGLEIIEQENQGAESSKSSPARINSLVKRKYLTELHQLSEEGQQAGLTGNLGEPIGDSQINLDVFGPIAEHDFAATLQKNQNSQIQLGVHSSLPQNLLDTKLNTQLNQLQMNIQKTSEPYESPSPTLNADREDVDSGTVDEEKEVIHEADERSSQQSKIRVSVSSLRKIKQNFTGDLADLSVGVPEPDVLVRKGSQELKKSTIEAPMMSKSGIKSVYEAEEQALKRGIIKAYSGKDAFAGQKRKEQANTDLQHFLLKGKHTKDDSLRISGFSQRKSDNSASQERGRYARSSYKNGTQNKNQRSIDSSRTLNNNTSLKENLNVNTIQKNHRAEANSSPLAVTQKSSMGINITRIAKKTNLRNRTRSTTPTDKNKQLTLQGYQQKAHENIEAARQLINEARVLKLDTEEINKQLLDLFRNKQDTKNLDKMMKQAMKELDAPGTSITSKRRGLEIPVSISQPGKENFKRAKAGSIMTQQLSSSSHGGKEIQIFSIAPSFAPNSPTSTTANAEANPVVRPSITFGLNSVGASTNRASKWELPVFGGIVSSRVGDLVDSKTTIKKIDEGHMQSHDAMRSPQSEHNYLAVAYHDGRPTAQIIDYNQNIMNTVTSHRHQDIKIRKGSFQISNDDYVKKQSISSRKNSTKGSKASSHKPQRPQTAKGYGRTRFQAPPPIQTAKRPDAFLLTMASDLSSKGVRMHSGPSPKLRTDTNGTFRVMTTIREDEHLEQPHWATRQNLKSKFNLMSAAQQAQQAQKWLIVADKTADKSNDRVATAQLQTITSMSPKNAPHTMSQVTTPQNQNAIKYGISPKHLQQQIQIQLHKQRDSPRKIMSMPIQSDDQFDSQQRNYDDQYSMEYAKNQASDAQFAGPIPASLSSGNPIAPMFASSNERMMNDQSQQVSLNHNMSPNLEDAIDTHRILTRHQKDAVSNASQSQLYEQPMINKYSSNMKLHRNSSKSLVNSRRIIETVQDQGYVKRSRAGEKYFSLSQNMIQGNVGQRKQSHQNQ